MHKRVGVRRRGSGRRLIQAILLGLLITGGSSRALAQQLAPAAPPRAAQTPASPPPKAATASPTPAPAPTTADAAAVQARLEALEAEVARQREQLAAQQAQLDLAAQSGAATSPAAPAADAVNPDELAAYLQNPLPTPEGEAEATEDGSAPIRLYGFADVGLQRIWADKILAELAPETNKLTFVLGNVNLYFDASPSKDFRFLAEVRLGLFPDGSTPRPNGAWSLGERFDDGVSDPTAANAFFTSIRWSGISLERVHIDWTPSDQFNLRAGLFLTPYGIFNVDHGSPTRIMVSQPMFIACEIFPTQMIGVEAFGTLPFLPWTLGYHLYVSNGRTLGPVDFSDSKALGGRVFMSTRAPFPMKFGLSAYAGDTEDVENTLLGMQTNFSYDELALSGDVSLDMGALRIRSELVVSWTYWDDGKHWVWAGTALADVMHLGAYVLAAYQLPWYGIEPMIMAEILRYPVPRLVPIGEGLVVPSVGVNVYFTDTTMLRTQISIAHGFDLSDYPVHTKGFLYQAVARLITAF